jgi:hypothetical protein
MFKNIESLLCPSFICFFSKLRVMPLLCFHFVLMMFSLFPIFSNHFRNVAPVEHIRWQYDVAILHSALFSRITPLWYVRINCPDHLVVNDEMTQP